MNNESGNGDAVDHVRCRSPRIVVVGSGEAAIVRGNPVVELTHAGDSAQTRRLKGLWKKFRLAAKAAKQLHQKVIFVQPVAGIRSEERRVGKERRSQREMHS